MFHLVISIRLLQPEYYKSHKNEQTLSAVNATLASDCSRRLPRASALNPANTTLCIAPGKKKCSYFNDIILGSLTVLAWVE